MTQIQMKTKFGVNISLEYYRQVRNKKVKNNNSPLTIASHSHSELSLLTRVVGYVNAWKCSSVKRLNERDSQRWLHIYLHLVQTTR